MYFLSKTIANDYTLYIFILYLNRLFVFIYKKKIFYKLQTFYTDIIYLMISFIYLKVNHSQRLNLPPETCWTSINDDGQVLTGHCSCMAGLGEVCTHVATILFLLYAWARKIYEENVSVSSFPEIKMKIDFGKLGPK